MLPFEQPARGAAARFASLDIPDEKKGTGNAEVFKEIEITEKKSLIIFAATLSLLSACGSAGAKEAKEPESPPTLHTIEYDSDLDTLDDELGADAFNHTLDHTDSKYYVINDYYNMVSGDGLHILSNFKTYQQTTEYSCACASALMVLEHFGVHDYNEMDICRLAGTDSTEGTSAENLAAFFKSLDWEVVCHADTGRQFQSINECEEFIITKLDSNTPIMVDWVDWGGHWQVIIGLDSCGTDDPNDDVLIMADPYDTTDHYQDGYFVVPLARFCKMWREGSGTEDRDPYQQPYIIATPAKD